MRKNPNNREQVIPSRSLVLLHSGFDYVTILFKSDRTSFQESPVSKRYAQKIVTNPIQRYEALVAEKQWEKALSVARNIIDANPEIDTSWFNCGVCLDEMERYNEAAEAFIKAQEINIEDWGIHYRIFRSLFLANDLDQFLEFADYSCSLNADTLASLISDEDFCKLFERPEFDALRRKYT